MLDRANQSCDHVVLNICRLRAVSLLLIALISLGGCRTSQPSAFDNESEVVGALLAEDWARVADLTKVVTAETPSAELRFLKAHALLALDKNNESSCQFLSVVTGDGPRVAENLNKWQVWTQKLAENNPNNATGHYLRGDALARLERWDEALLSFNKALELNPNHTLSLNARGLVYAVREQWDPALVDLTKAISLNQGHAGTYANLGAFWMMKQVGAKGAEASFSNALEISPDFVVASYGRGCVRSVLGKQSEAKDDLKNAANRASCLSDFLFAKIDSTLARIGEKEEAKMAQARGENPSMGLNADFKEILKNPSKDNYFNHYKAIVNTVRENPSLAPLAQDRFGKLTRDPMYAESHRYAQSRLQNETRWIENVSTARSDAYTELSASMGPVQFKTGITGQTSARLALDQARRTSRAAESISPPGFGAKGFKTGLEEAVWDQGNWPFETMNGLFYKMQSVKISSKTEKGAGK